MLEEVRDADGVDCERRSVGDRRVTTHEDDFGYFLPRLRLPALLQEILVDYVVVKLEHADVAGFECRVVVDFRSSCP